MTRAMAAQERASPGGNDTANRPLEKPSGGKISRFPRAARYNLWYWHRDSMITAGSRRSLEHHRTDRAPRAWRPALDTATVDHNAPAPACRNVIVRSFDDIAGYEHSMRLATTSMVVREAPTSTAGMPRIDLGRVRLNSAEYSASLSTRSIVRWPRFFFLTGNGRPAVVSGRDFDRGTINFMAENGPVSMVSDKHMAWTSIEFAPDLLTSDFALLNGRSGPRLEHGAMFRVAGTAAWDRLKDVCRTAFRVGMTEPPASIPRRPRRRRPAR